LRTLPIKTSKVFLLECLVCNKLFGTKKLNKTCATCGYVEDRRKINREARLRRLRKLRIKQNAQKKD